MLAVERKNQILYMLEKNHALSVRKLATELYSSEATVRRDLNSLEEAGLVKRVFGGVMLTKYVNLNVPLSVREHESRKEKEQIAAAAAGLIRDGDSILLDASSTVQWLVPHLRKFNNLTVITSCTKSLDLLSEMGIKTFCTGGEMIRNSLAFTGRYAEAMIRDIRADILFFSCQGLALDGRLSDSSNDETRLRQVMLQSAGKKVLLCDSSKIAKQFMFKLCDLSDIDEVLSDAPLPPELLEKQAQQSDC